MLETITHTAANWSQFYCDLIANWWHTITFWQYIAVMVACLTLGAIWLSRGADGRT